MIEITEEFKTWWETSLHEASFRNHLPYPPPDSTILWAWAAWRAGRADEREEVVEKCKMLKWEADHEDFCRGMKEAYQNIIDWISAREKK